MNPEVESVNGRTPKPITVRHFAEHQPHELLLRLVAGTSGLERPILEPTVSRPGLLLAGFRDYFAEYRVQVMGSVEMYYLDSLAPDLRRERLEMLFSTRIPCVVLCRDYEPDAVIKELAERTGIPVFVCPLVTMNFISRATLELEELFAPTEKVHGSMVDILGIGVLIMGEPGIGKSECAIGLIERGYALVADDCTQVRLHSGRELIGSCPNVGRNFMEVRGIGIVDVPAMFGVKCIRTEKRVDLVVTLKKSETGDDAERVGAQYGTRNILGIELPHTVIPICPGRDVARLVEVAAYHMKLRILGYNPAEAFNEALIRSMRRPPAPGS